MKVTIEQHRNRYRLRWIYEGKRYTLSTGAPANPIGRNVAEKKKLEIETDLLTGNFDKTLVKYRPRTIGKNHSEILLADLFGKFSDHKLRNEGLSLRSIETRYKPLQRQLARLYPNTHAHEFTRTQARNFKAVCEENLKTSATAKARLWLLQSCFEWAKTRYHVPPENPWAGLASEIRVQRSVTLASDKIFSLSELKQIAISCRQSAKFEHYADLIQFAIATAARPGECFGIRWSDLAKDHSSVVIHDAVSRGKRTGRTKTGKNRTVYLPESLQAVLKARYERLGKPTGLIFTSKRGKLIDDKNFSRRVWKPLLIEARVDHKTFYSVRHSALSHAYANGASPADLAAQAGHSVQTFLETYCHATKQEYLLVEVI